MYIFGHANDTQKKRVCLKATLCVIVSNIVRWKRQSLGMERVVHCLGDDDILIGGHRVMQLLTAN